MLWVRHYVCDEALWRRKHLTVGGGLPGICREPAAKSAQAVYQVHSGAAAQPIAAVNLRELPRPSGRSRFGASSTALCLLRGSAVSAKLYRNAGTTCLMNSSSDFFFSACGRLLSHQKLNSSTPSSW